ncbi:hypothetical protein, partial [Embleya hyalina]|uniref:hypothetical protein n=1 Tax=Embleya hyalina TaxID=516124 RepID=UPI001C3F7976
APEVSKIVETLLAPIVSNHAPHVLSSPDRTPGSRLVYAREPAPVITTRPHHVGAALGILTDRDPPTVLLRPHRPIR